MNLTRRKALRSEPETFLPEFRRYKHYPIGHDEEEAIKQAEVCLDALSDKMIEVGDDDRATILCQSYDVIRRMRLTLATMGATRTTMDYN
jgi:hypothetical protein